MRASTASPAASQARASVTAPAASTGQGCHRSRSRRLSAMRSASARPAAASGSVCLAIAQAWAMVVSIEAGSRSALLALPLRWPK